MPVKKPAGRLREAAAIAFPVWPRWVPFKKPCRQRHKMREGPYRASIEGGRRGEGVWQQNFEGAP